MIIIMFTILYMLLMFNAFTVSFHLSAVNKAIVNTPKEIFETSIVIVNLVDEDNLYFDKELLNKNLLSYYQRVIKNHLTSYTVNQYFYNQNNGSVCTSENCNAVEVSVVGKYSYYFDYSRTLTYEIRKGAKYGQ